MRVGQPAVAAQLVASDKINDVSLLKAEKGPSAVAAFANDGATKQGSRVVVFGYPLDGALASGGTATAGTVSALVGFGDNTSQLQITAPIQQGNSGGPVFDQFGAVIGVVVSKLDAIAVAKIIGDIPQNEQRLSDAARKLTEGTAMHGVR